MTHFTAKVECSDEFRSELLSTGIKLLIEAREGTSGGGLTFPTELLLVSVKSAMTLSYTITICLFYLSTKT